VIVGPRRALAVSAAMLGDLNWLGGSFDGPLSAKVRSMAKPVPARFDGVMVHFEAPEYGVSPGQAAVLYTEDRVLGGGWIEATVPAEGVLAAA
jgi:tRNA-specific 2-thiouridylase